VIKRLLLPLLCVLQLVDAEPLSLRPNYQISEQAAPFFANKNAKVILHGYLDSHPLLKQRLIDPSYLDSDQTWAYHTQTYLNLEVLSYLVSLQIKAMAERKEIRSLEDIFDTKYGIGSKSHKDKGTINNPLSLWGHPVQKEVLGRKSRLNTLRVYTALRETVKNDLIHYGRNQALGWHQKTTEQKLAETINYLEKHHSEKTSQLRKRLKMLNYDLETLIRKVIETHLIS